MERWAGRVAVVTGASSGIGAGIAKELVKHGLTVVGMARRVDRIQDMVEEFQGEKGKLLPVKADLRNEEDILEAFAWIEKNTSGIDVLVNNAGAGRFDSLLEGKTESWKEIVDLNVIGLSVCTREAVKSMKKKGTDDGVIINISSMLGHSNPSAMFSMYSGSKRMVIALSESLQNELRASGSRIRVTNVSPGLVATEVVTNPDVKCPPGYKVPEFFSKNPLLPSDIAHGVVFVLSADPRVHIPQLSMLHNYECDFNEFKEKR